ncbi:cytoskeleton protein RodZ [Tolumonas osonensis]|uniref:Cytoskeleton protein RodZ n=1 Tax=Tolumonas osonensis TaxID=675874 RepID=A0A841GB83_9GAMM|nr:cytoskeleton protein RodZ [Tolumonas osonensis]MBB6056358.1 cytoskeleton protein RodZ [Tolumonas osonensis]
MTTEQRHETAQPTPGSILKAAREQKGLSQQDVAHRLNLRISLIRDIEEDRFDQKTASTFTRGYLKTYARFVSADEQAVLDAYDRLGLDDKKYTEMYSFSGRTQREASEHRVRLISWVLCVGLAAVGAAWWWLQPAEEPVPTSINEAGQLVVKAATNAVEAVAPASVDSTEAAVSKALPTVTSEVTNTDLAAVPATDSEANSGNDTDEVQEPTVLSDAAANADTQNQAAVVPAAAETPLVSPINATASAAASSASSTVSDAPQKNEVDPSVALQLQFSAGCWLRVTDATGKTLFEGTKNAGDKINLNGQEPYSLIIGAPRAVSVYFHGQAVDMSSYIRQGVVARYKLPLKN